MEAGQFAAAIPALEKAARAHPEKPEFVRAYGAAVAASGDLEGALPHLERACRLRPRLALACFQYGRTLYFLNRFDLALQAYEDAQAAQDMGATLYSARAQALEALGRSEEADLEYRKALADSALRAAQSADIQLKYGLFLYRRGMVEAALWQYEQAIRKTPHIGVLWREKARALLQLGREGEAAKALEQALAHGERKKENVLLLSRLYERLGEAQKAETLRREASEQP